MTQNRNLVRIFLFTVLILSVPLIAMQFTSEVKWNLTDFVVAAGLLIGSGVVYELLARRIKTVNFRIAVGLAITIVLVLAWAQLAVGIL